MSIPRFSPSFFDMGAERFGETYAGSPSISLGSFIRDGVVLSTSSYSGIPNSTAAWPQSMANYVGLTSPRVWTTQANHLYTANNGNKVMTLNSRWYAHCFNGGSSLGSSSPSSTPEKFINNVWSTSQGPTTVRTLALAGGIYNDSITTGGRNASSGIAVTETYNGTSWTTRLNQLTTSIGGCAAGSTTDFIAGSGNASTSVATSTGRIFYSWNNTSWTQIANSPCGSFNDFAAGWGKPNFGNSGFHHAGNSNSVHRYDSAANTWSNVGTLLYQSTGGIGNHGSSQSQTTAGGGGLAGVICTQTSTTANSGIITKYSGRLAGEGLGSTQQTQPSLPKNGGTLGTPYNNNWYTLLSHGSIYSFGWINYTSTSLLQVTSTTTNQQWQ